MKKKLTLISLLVLAASLLILVSGCSEAAVPGLEALEPTATSPPEGEEAAGDADETGTRPVIPEAPSPEQGPRPTEDLGSALESVAAGAVETISDATARDWVGLGAWVVVVLLVILFGRGLIRGLLRRLAKRTSTEFDDKFVEEIMPQIYAFVVVFVLQIATITSDLIGDQLTALLGNVYFLLYLWIGVTIVWKLIDYAATWYTEQVPEETRTDAIDRTLPLIKRVAHIAVIGIAISMFLNHLGVDIYVLAATLGIAGLAISLAAQDTIADMISGFVIYVDQPFRIGDRIEISGLGTWGDVVDIGTRTTRIRTRDNRLVIVPNSTIADSQVVNYTFPDPRYRVQVDIGIEYGMDIEKTRRVIIDAVSKLDGVLKDKPVDALYNEMGDSSMIFRVRWWIESYEDTRRIYDRVNTALQAALDEAGIVSPNPIHDMNFRIDQANADRLSQAFHSPN